MAKGFLLLTAGSPLPFLSRCPCSFFGAQLCSANSSGQRRGRFVPLYSDPKVPFLRAPRNQAREALCTRLETRGSAPPSLTLRPGAGTRAEAAQAGGGGRGGGNDRLERQGPIPAMAAQPVPVSKQTREVVGGIPTEVVCTAFGATILVVVTQYGKMGTLVSVEPDAVAEGISRSLWTTKVLLGKDEPLVHISAKHLVTSVSQEAGNKAVLLAMALKDRSIEGIRTLKELIHRCRVW